MSVIGVVSVGVVQANVNAEVYFVVLRVPPPGIDDLVRIRGGIDGAIGNAIVHTVVAIVVDPVSQAIGPIPSGAGITDTRLGRRRARRRGRGTILARLIPRIGKDNVVVGVVGCGMIENGFLRSRAGIGRIKKGSDCPLQREGTLHRGATQAEEETTKQESCQCLFQ